MIDVCCLTCVHPSHVLQWLAALGSRQLATSTLILTLLADTAKYYSNNTVTATATATSTPTRTSTSTPAAAPLTLDFDRVQPLLLPWFQAQQVCVHVMMYMSHAPILRALLGRCMSCCSVWMWACCMCTCCMRPVSASTIRCATKCLAATCDRCKCTWSTRTHECASMRLRCSMSRMHVIIMYMSRLFFSPVTLLLPCHLTSLVERTRGMHSVGACVCAVHVCMCRVCHVDCCIACAHVCDVCLSSTSTLDLDTRLYIIDVLYHNRTGQSNTCICHACVQRCA